jgi:hypothetical protein
MPNKETALLSIRFCKNKLKVIYPYIKLESDLQKVDDMKIDMDNNTEDDIISIGDIIDYFHYDTYTDEQITYEVNKIIRGIRIYERQAAASA